MTAFIKILSRLQAQVSQFWIYTENNIKNEFDDRNTYNLIYLYMMQFIKMLSHAYLRSHNFKFRA